MSDITIVEQKLVTLYEDKLLAVKAADNSVYVSINQMCEALSIAAPMQRRRIRDHEILSEGYVLGTVLTEGGEQRATLLRVDLVPLWLIGIQLKSVSEEVYPKLKLFVRRAADVLSEAFSEGRLTADPAFEDLLSTGSPAVQAYKMASAIMQMARQQILLEANLETHKIQLGDHENRLEQIEEQLGDPRRQITPEQAMQISQAVKAIALEIGKRSKRNEYGGVYGELYRRYEINSYKNLPKSKFEDALNWLNEWLQSLIGEAPF
jgi:ferritin-like metal-binding protein YciE